MNAVKKIVNGANKNAPKSESRSLGKHCLILGGCGYLGNHLSNYLLGNSYFRQVTVADIKPPPADLAKGANFLFCDVRIPLDDQIALKPYDWIFNFAAVHREPGHEAHEYFDTNVAGAKNVCAFADLIKCKKIFFSASIAVYGKITTPVSEKSPTYPDTPYGISKLYAELVHTNWAEADEERKLVIIRPGVIYGPGDPGNVLRMIKAIQKGIFVMPMKSDIRKSYGYIYGLLDSIAFTMKSSGNVLTYNYVEKETEPLIALVQHVKQFLGINLPTLKIPSSMLEIAAISIELLPVWKGNINATRVRKISRSTHVIPAKLIELGFSFNFDFQTSLRHWRKISPQDF